MSKKQTPAKSKLFKLKEWLIVPDAARHLSIVFEEEISEADVLRLALDGQLKLSVYFVNHVYAIPGNVVPYEDVEWYPDDSISEPSDLPEEAKDRPEWLMKSKKIADNRYLNLEKEVIKIKGIWDLSMIGNERLNIENEYQVLTDGPGVTISTLGSAYVESEEGQICQLQYRCGEGSPCGSDPQLVIFNDPEIDHVLFSDSKRPYMHPDNFFPANGLSGDVVIVVRTKALIDLQESLSSEELTRGKTLETDAKTSILNNNHAFYAKELRIAVEAWTALYEKNSPQHVPKGGHKKYITKWLEEKYPSLSQRARERIATVINPNPKGGASSTN